MSIIMPFLIYVILHIFIALNSFDSLAIIMLVPIFDQYIYPWAKGRGHPLTMLQRIGWGFVFSTLAMLVAAVIETYRLAEAPAGEL